jgi:hypothetical protein
VIRAWALLIDNIDVVDWLSCLMMIVRRQSCLSRVLDTRWTRDVRVHFRTKEDSRRCKNAPFSGNGTRDRIVICYSSGPWQRYRRMWSSEDDEVRTCGLVDFSATLLHELTHVCGYNEPGPGECAESYRIENSFRWAMAQRFTAARKNPCCGGLPGYWRNRTNEKDDYGPLNSLWNWDRTIYPDISYCI